MKRVLECSSKGDKRYSAFYAKINLFGKTDSIENFYQLAKRSNNFVPQTWRDMKGKKPTHYIINGKRIPLKYGKAFYELMWVKYFDTNPHLITYAKQFDDFNDIFKLRNAYVCQADVIKDYMLNGRESIVNRNKEFFKIINILEV